LGQLGHGKTTLASAITKVLSERIAEVRFRSFESIQKMPPEKARGMAIALARLEYATARRHYAHADCVRHADHVKNLIAGVAEMQGAILVVAADAGITAETREHARLARQVGIAAVVVALNKAELASQRVLSQLEADLRKLLSSHGYRGGEAPVVPVSALRALQGEGKWKQSIQDLMNAIDSHVPLPPRPEDGPFLMPVEDVFAIPGRGAIVTGKVNRGVIKVGEKVAIVGLRATRETVVTGVEMFKKLLKEGRAGDRVGLLLRGVGREQVERGQVVARPGSIAARARLRAEVYMLTREEGGRQTPFFQGYRPQFYFRTTDVTGVAKLPERREAGMPGEHLPLEVELVQPVAIEKGMRFAIREGGRTVGVGIVVEVV
jgi:elongation factor Tu